MFRAFILTFIISAHFVAGSDNPNQLINSNHKYCNGITNCLGYAMDVIHNSDRYTLFESLWFDAINGTNHSYVITASDPKNLTELVKKATELFNTHYLIWKIAPGLNVKVFKKNEDKFGMSVLKDTFPPKYDGRTFGIGKRRIMMALLPIMFKLGVIMTLLVFLTFITLKTLTIGVLLLMLGFGGLVAKLKSGHSVESSHSTQPAKDIHIHVHGGYPGDKHSPSHYEYSPWHRESGWQGEESSDQSYSSHSSTVPPWSYLPPYMSY